MTDENRALCLRFDFSTRARGLSMPRMPVPPENLVRVSMTGLMANPNVSSPKCLATIARFGGYPMCSWTTSSTPRKGQIRPKVGGW